ncbi:MAG: phosphoribosylglycinamide formyltransferase [Flavobacteriales bacterium]|nr:MAG: phosphoribosylglycinamide formyltransferase [Flavobacteriales bacterium]
MDVLPKKKQIILFASGSGTNVENIVRHFQDSPNIEIRAVLSNNKEAQVLDRCNTLNISAMYFNKTAFLVSDVVIALLKALEPDLIVLAGFLLKIPPKLIESFPQKIINIHPALLPKYGGKGMYGSHVHEEVARNHDKETGITLHYVNENYDEGAIIFQKKIALTPDDTASAIAEKVHRLEYEYFPKVIENLLMAP